MKVIKNMSYVCSTISRTFSANSVMIAARYTQQTFSFSIAASKFIQRVIFDLSYTWQAKHFVFRYVSPVFRENLSSSCVLIGRTSPGCIFVSDDRVSSSHLHCFNNVYRSKSTSYTDFLVFVLERCLLFSDSLSALQSPIACTQDQPVVLRVSAGVPSLASIRKKGSYSHSPSDRLRTLSTWYDVRCSLPGAHILVRSQFYNEERRTFFLLGTLRDIPGIVVRLTPLNRIGISVYVCLMLFYVIFTFAPSMPQEYPYTWHFIRIFFYLNALPSYSVVSFCRFKAWLVWKLTTSFSHDFTVRLFYSLACIH
jgi:hypothetical protein